MVVCLGLGCGSGSPPVVKTDGGQDRPIEHDAAGDATARDTTTSTDAHSDALSIENCPATKAKYDAAAYADAASCSSKDDTDRDGVPDCLDGCPYDQTKVAPGACGCNTPDSDSDGDGVADCIDECPLDPNNTVAGDCGCLGEVGLAPAGTACIDPACPQPNPTCDGAGVCGSRAACSPCPGGRYIVTTFRESRYWFCGAVLPRVTGPRCLAEDAGTGGGGTTRAAAETACQSTGLALARINTSDDDDFLASLLTAPLWIGANDLATPGQWYWPSSTSDSDKLIWSGGADGSQENSSYVEWAAGAPGSSSCASIRTDGRWVDTGCDEMHGYICQAL
jgi:hypothetical protein